MAWGMGSGVGTHMLSHCYYTSHTEPKKERKKYILNNKGQKPSSPFQTDRYNLASFSDFWFCCNRCELGHL